MLGEGRDELKHVWHEPENEKWSHEMVVVVFHECIVCARGTVGVLFASGMVMVVLIADEKLAKTPQCPAYVGGKDEALLCVSWLSVRGSLAPNVPKMKPFVAILEPKTSRWNPPKASTKRSHVVRQAKCRYGLLPCS